MKIITYQWYYNICMIMRKLKILWLSSNILEEPEKGRTGTWLYSMSNALIDKGIVELGNISTGSTKSIRRSDYGQIKQWVIPFSAKLNKDGLPNNKIVNSYLTAINDFKPDLIHVWGTESYAGLITAKKVNNLPVLLEMQGLIRAIAKIFHGDLSIKEQIQCIGIKEILRKSNIFQQKRRYEKWATFENEIILNHKYITTSSRWMEAQVRAINPKANIFHNEIMLRNTFYTSKKWQFTGDSKIFTLAAYSSPFKGFHIAIRAIANLKRKYPKIQLRIAGLHQINGIRRNGYINWIRKEIKNSNLESNIIWLGALNGRQIVEELIRSSVVVLPSYIESYGVAHVEAMAIGTPCVCSFNGGAAYLGEDEKTSLFFPPGDDVMCAFQIERILSNKELAESISKMARDRTLIRNDSEQIVNRQIQIYKEILNIV
jgi:glycosyltransferase involved in cell wall biosynthesis